MNNDDKLNIIYLIDDHWDINRRSWCADPAPEVDMDADKAVKYIRYDDHLAEIEQLRKEVDEGDEFMAMCIEELDRHGDSINSVIDGIAKVVTERNKLRKENEAWIAELLTIKRIANICSLDYDEMDIALHQIAINADEALKTPKGDHHG